MKSILSQRKRNSTIVGTLDHTVEPVGISTPITVGTQPIQSSLPSPTQPITESRFKYLCTAICEFRKKIHQNLRRTSKSTIRHLSCQKGPLNNPNSKTADMLHRRNTEAESENDTELSSPFGSGRSTDPFGSRRSCAAFPSGKPTPRASILPNRERPWGGREGEGIMEGRNPWDAPDYWR